MERTIDFTVEDDVWFHDGNVVIVAGDATFRLYKGLLTSVSPVFTDLFSIPRPEDEETMDGCPVVHLSDSPSDLRHFFRMLSKPSLEMTREDALVSFSALAAIARVAHKYQAVDVVDIAGRRLEKFFAASEVLLTANKHHVNSWDELWEEHQKHCSLRVEIKDAIQAISLARLLNRQKMLPFALFLCCAGDPLHLRNGVRCEDEKIERLSDPDYLLCLQALPELKQGCHDALQRAFDQFVPITNSQTEFGAMSCIGDPGKCKAAVVEMRAAYKTERFEGAVTDIFARSLIHRTSPPNAYRSRRDSLCIICRMFLGTMPVREISRTWAVASKFLTPVDDVGTSV